MALALSLLFDAESGLPIRGIWSAFAETGVSRDMLDLDYAPHVTLIIVDDESLAEPINAGLAALAPLVPDTVRLGEVRQFPDTPVVWIECLADFRALHEAAATLVPLDSIRPHYRPGAWTPHVTLQVAGDAPRAIEIARRKWQPRPARPVRLETATFVPVKALEGVDIAYM
jgi:2'-5' RNA ligase